ncbi:hypothetical protein C8R42DRAFT_680382 [Lentinula raphanica]|nr:hypothetical protein C8R42DRAFT_680382 [Lentinula raphanica]
MYLFRLVFTWYSLAANILLLSMILAAIALPMDPSTTTQSEGTRKRDRETANLDAAGLSSTNAVVISSESNGSRKLLNTRPPRKQRLAASGSQGKVVKPRPNQSSEARSTPKMYIIAVIIENGKAEWTEKQEVDPLARWVVALILLEDANRLPYQFWGYETIRDDSETAQSETKWKMRVDKRHHRFLYGAWVALSERHLVLEIGTLTTSQDMKSLLTKKMRAELATYHFDQLPSVLSIYQFLLLFHQQALKHLHVQVHSFDISEFSDFGKAFKQIVRKKGTGAGGVMSQWEWELYERIQSKSIILEDSLWKHKNQDILVELRADVLDVPPEFLASQDMEDYLDHPTLAGPSSPSHDQDISGT